MEKWKTIVGKRFKGSKNLVEITTIFLVFINIRRRDGCVCLKEGKFIIQTIHPFLNPLVIVCINPEHLLMNQYILIRILSL